MHAETVPVTPSGVAMLLLLDVQSLVYLVDNAHRRTVEPNRGVNVGHDTPFIYFRPSPSHTLSSPLLTIS